MIDALAPRLVPARQWHYPERPGQEPIRAGSYSELVDALIQDRVDNQKTIGDPENDIRLYILKNFPDSASSVPSNQAAIPKETLSRNLRERVQSWLGVRYALRAGGNDVLVSQEEAERRAQICAKCPANKEVPNDCPPCRANNNRTGFLLRQGQQTETQVKFCEITGQCNSTASFLPEKMLKHRNRYLGELKEKAPACWLLNL